MGRVRITGGQWRGRYWPVLEGEGIRPTKSFLREVVFNWLGQDCVGLRWWEGFAGSGVMSFEALSRGAESVVMVDASPKAVAELRANIGAWEVGERCAVHCQALPDGFSTWVIEGPGVVYLDPPYDWDHAQWLKTLEALKEASGSGEGVAWMLEHDARRELPSVGGWSVHKHRRQGGSAVTWMRLDG